MAISDRTRKILWARSGNRCAFCRCELVMARTETDPEGVVGDEVHIIGSRAYSARHDPHARVDLDGYENLILLCKTHHKLVDDQPQQHTVNWLRELKDGHEEWVQSTLEGATRHRDDKPPFHGVTLIPRLRTSKELTRVLSGAHLLTLDNDELETEGELNMVSSFVSLVQDFDVIWELGPSEAIRTEFALSSEMRDLENMGFHVYGAQQQRRLKLGNVLDTWRVATVCVVRETNPAIVDIQGHLHLIALDCTFAK